MKKAQVIKLWRALRDSTNSKETVSQLANKSGYGGKRTLERYAQANLGFSKASSSGVVANKAGWKLPYVNKIREWWEGEFKTTAATHANAAGSDQMETLTKELRILRVDGVQTDAAAVLNQFAAKLAVGVSEYDIPMEFREVMTQLSHLQLVEIQQRRVASGPRSWDQGYWILTDLGKKVVWHLHRTAYAT
ncbi:MAG: hypothetical protein HYX90_03460 [Chloroflexi bacterium]|nr:hypothetical protein [Chloroflexota bacterium]